MTAPDDQERLNREALEWLSRVRLGDATQDDLAALRRWRDTSPAHAAALTRARDLWRVLNVPVAELVQEGAARARRPFQPSRRALLAGGGAMAAAAAGVMVVRPPLELWPSLAELRADYRTGTGEQRRLTLEAVSVELNTRTSVAVRGSGPNSGMELISGELAVAIPRAMPRPFIVAAGEGRASSDRGSFTVRRREAAVEITCIDGAVLVQCGGHEAAVRAGQRIAYGRDSSGRDSLGDIAGADLATLTAWRDGLLMFRNTPLSTVIDEVNRYRPGRIVLVDPSLGARQVTARFEIKQLDTVMEQLAGAFKVPVKSLPGGLVLVG